MYMASKDDPALAPTIKNPTSPSRKNCSPVGPFLACISRKTCSRACSELYGFFHAPEKLIFFEE